jgi:hypothetical protein
MNKTIQNYTKGTGNPNENIFVEVAMTTVFVAIIVFSALVLLSV